MRKNTKYVFLILFCILLIPLSFRQSSAQQKSLNGLETSDYKKVAVVIEDLPEDAIRIGLTKERIRARCELRLRQAGLESVSSILEKPERLYIGIYVVGAAFSAKLEFLRPVHFNAQGISYQTLGTTWKRIATGTHGQDPTFVIQKLDGLLGIFLTEYLKANSK